MVCHQRTKTAREQFSTIDAGTNHEGITKFVLLNLRWYASFTTSESMVFVSYCTVIAFSPRQTYRTPHGMYFTPIIAPRSSITLYKGCIIFHSGCATSYRAPIMSPFQTPGSNNGRFDTWVSHKATQQELITMQQMHHPGSKTIV